MRIESGPEKVKNETILRYSKLQITTKIETNSATDNKLPMIGSKNNSAYDVI